MTLLSAPILDREISEHIDVWSQLQFLSVKLSEKDPLFRPRLDTDLIGFTSKEICANAFVKFTSHTDLATDVLFNICLEALESDSLILPRIEKDLEAFVDRDPSTSNLLHAFLYRKGFHALLIYRIANFCWENNKSELALLLSSVCSCSLSVDIHPAATLDGGLMLDHATGIVIGETALVNKNVSMLHNVTLGGTGKASGDRHPKVREGVLLGAGSIILGNIEIGTSSKVAAGSVVLDDVPPHTTVAGIPAKIVRYHNSEICPSSSMDQKF